MTRWVVEMWDLKHSECLGALDKAYRTKWRAVRRMREENAWDVRLKQRHGRFAWIAVRSRVPISVYDNWVEHGGARSFYRRPPGKHSQMQTSGEGS